MMVQEYAPLNKTLVYTNGSYVKNGDDDAKAGSRVWFGRQDQRNISAKVPGITHSNQTGEVYAIQCAAQAEQHRILHIKSDSKYVIEDLTKHIREWDNKGWIGVKNGPRI